MKVCVKCNENKEDNEFSLQTGLGKTIRKPRLCSWCKSCSSKHASESNKRKRKENPELQKEKDRINYNKNKKVISIQSGKRRKAFKAKCVEYLGGCCIVCGFNKYNSALDFHHINSEEKDFMITSTTQMSDWEMIRMELNKCVLLCSNCHRGVHSKDIVLEEYFQLDAV
jgi:hypothetical protein